MANAVANCPEKVNKHSLSLQLVVKSTLIIRGCPAYIRSSYDELH